MALIVPIVEGRTTLRCAVNGNGILLSHCPSACKVFVILPASHGQVSTSPRGCGFIAAVVSSSDQLASVVVSSVWAQAVPPMA